MRGGSGVKVIGTLSVVTEVGDFHEIARLPGHQRERARGRVAAPPHAPLRRAGEGLRWRGDELHLVRIRIPAPDFENVRIGGKELVGRGVGRIAVEKDAIPATLEGVGGGLPLRVRAGDESRDGDERAENFHWTVRR